MYRKTDAGHCLLYSVAATLIHGVNNYNLIAYRMRGI
ncbi:hypothetical protein DFQ50_10942 [Pseudocitrobacter faecalis]|uniref:Uncharacterized protein n=1 Tax=Pseudocitrobacter faecalis TaxID=1398493 RepID=A0ABX9FU68_9ENTR|nr:hypothetical protein DFQ50_10942 [Pseudocitrobacter faecalis]